MLLLFDIDGTLLIRAADDHRDAIHAALRRVYHVPDPAAARVEPRGGPIRRSPGRSSCSSACPPSASTSGMLDFKRAAAEEYARRCRSDLTAFVAPGVVEVLDELPRATGVGSRW